MRRLLIVGAVISLVLSSSSVRARQDPAPPLQRLIYSQFEMRLPLTFCDVPAAVASLADPLLQRLLISC
jgi:hypothetical protein